MSKPIGLRIALGLLSLAAAGIALILILPDETGTTPSATGMSPVESRRVETPAEAAQPAGLEVGEAQEGSTEAAQAEVRVVIGGSATGELALEGRLLAPGGGAIEGAAVSWTPQLEPDDPLDPASRELDARRLRILAASIHTVTGEGGEFRFEEQPPGIEDRASVVWATHPGLWARAELLAEGGPPGRDCGELVAAPGEPIEVVVVDPEGKPIAGATVSHRLLWSGAEYDETLPENQAREMFRREYLSDEAGRVLVPAAEKGNVLVARDGARISAPWWGETSEQVTLTLGDSFLVRGRVRTDLPDPGGFGGHVSIGLFDAPDQKDFLWAGSRMNVRPDGSFGPARFQLAPRSFLLASLRDAGALAQTTITRAAPGPGEHVVLEIEARRGVAADVLVLDPHGAPVEGAGIQVNFEDETGVVSTTWSDEDTDVEGRTRVEGLPPGRIYVLASKDGYLDALLGWGTGSPCIVPRGEGEGPFVLQLGEQRRIAGRVLHRGRPVPSFEVAHWTGSEPADFTRFDDDEGRFEVIAPTGVNVALFAIAPELPQSELLELDAEADADDVELELPEGGICRGRLVDQMTGEPVRDAELRILALSGTVNAGFRRDVHRPDPDGSFELPGFVPGRGGLLITSEGYADHYSYVHADHGEIIEYGVVALEPLASLSVRAEGWSDARYEDFRLSGSLESLSAPRPLGADGTALLTGLRPGSCILYLTTPEQRTFAQTCSFSASAVTEVVFRRADGDASLQVEVESREPDLPLAGKILRLHGRPGAGDPVWRELSLPERGVHTFEGLAAGTFVIELSDEAGVLYAASTQELEPGEQGLVRMELERRSRRVRLLREDGTPVQTAPVQVTLPDAAGGWFQNRITDLAGELDLGALDADEVVLSFRPDNTSLVLGLHVALEDEGTTEVAVETPVTVSLELRELGEPCSGVKVLWAHASFPIQFSGPTYTSDGAGFSRGYDMPEGEYVLVLGDSPYWQESWPVRARASMEPVRLELHSRGDLVLDARGPEGLPLAGVAFALEHARFGADLGEWIARRGVRASSPELLTAASGKLELSGLPRGQYRWTAHFPDGSTRSGSADVPPRGLTTVEVR